MSSASVAESQRVATVTKNGKYVPASQANTSHDVLVYESVVPASGAGATMSATAKSQEITFLLPKNLNGIIKKVFAKILLTPGTANPTVLGGCAIDDLTIYVGSKDICHYSNVEVYTEEVLASTLDTDTAALVDTYTLNGTTLTGKALTYTVTYDLFVDITTALKGEWCAPSKMEDDVRISFRYSSGADWVTYGGGTLTASNPTLYLELIQSNFADDYARIYQNGSVSIVVPNTHANIALTANACTRASLSGFNGLSAFMMLYPRNTSADVGAARLTLTPITSYKVNSSSGTRILSRHDEVVTYAESLMATNDVFSIGMYPFTAHSFVFVPLGVTDVQDVLQHGSLRGGYVFDGTESVTLTASTTTHELGVSFWRYRSLEFKGGRLVSVENL